MVRIKISQRAINNLPIAKPLLSPAHHCLVLVALFASMAALRLSCFSSFLCHPLRLRPSSIFRLGFPSKAPPHFYATSSVVALEGSGIAPHPWPEWERFLDKLKSKGYFDKTLPAGEGEDGVAAASDEASMDLHHVKAACLSFARERFDIFK